MAERTIVLLCSALIAAGTVIASQDFAPVRGRIVDPTRSPIIGAHVKTPGGETVSDTDGEFVLRAGTGSLKLEITADGFAPVDRVLTVPEAGVDLGSLVLELAPVHAEVTVTESAMYQVDAVRSAAKSPTALRDLPQSISVVTRDLVNDQMMLSVGDVARYVPGVTAIQGENNRDQLVIRGNSSSADFFLNGIRDDVQYYRDLYNVEEVEALKGPNAMAFGRGGGGGVVNRVTKEAAFARFGEIALAFGSFGEKRVTADLNQSLTSRVAFRLNAMGEDAGSFRRQVALRRYAWNPTLTITATSRTRITLGFEHLRDDRVADRGVPSFEGRPIEVDASTYFGDPANSHAGARVSIGSASIDHRFGGLELHNRLTVGDYDRGYQNFVPGAVTSATSSYALSAYNNATRRRNIFNQTDATYVLQTGRARHTITGGIEAGRQATDNFRNTGYFNNQAVTFLAPLAMPTVSLPVTFRQSATDADNHILGLVAATYLQDQVSVTRWLEFIGGMRFDRFDLRYANRRTGEALRRADNVGSPRAGVVLKPVSGISLYANYSVSFLPSAGDQFSSLTTVTQQVKPERFVNREAGAKWEVTRRLFLTAAAYRLDRTNTRSTDPNDPARIVQTGSQRTNGVELGWNGRVTGWWSVAGGYSWQDGFVTSATVSAPAGAQAPQVPHSSFSLWNRYRIHPRLGVGLGILNRGDMFAAIDNTVVLPGYTRIDAAVFYSLTERIRVQANCENLLDRSYSINADGNNNISPGSPRAVRLGIRATF